ncbi:MAG TPA: hypothetical protein VGD55_11040 [Acidothermaceae bacterium]
MAACTLHEIETAIRRAWSLDTCDPVDVPEWSAANPARGQCGATALVLHDLLGGDLLRAEVRYADGSRQGHHYWNLLTGGVEIDLTAEQFGAGEVIQAPVVVARPDGPPRRCAEQYLRLRSLVLAELHVQPHPRRVVRR